MRDELLRGAAVKTVYGVPLDGPSLLSLTAQYLGAMNTPGVVPCIRSAWEHVVQEHAHAASAAALAEATEQLAALAATPPLPEAVAWAARAAELERGALVAFDGRALAGAAAAAARELLAEAVRREAANQLEALLRASRQLCEDAAVLAGAGALAEPAAAADGHGINNAAEVVGGLVQAYEDEAQGPARYDGLRALLTSQLAPWLAQVAAATAAAREQAAAAARTEHDTERDARCGCGAQKKQPCNPAALTT